MEESSEAHMDVPSSTDNVPPISAVPEAQPSIETVVVVEQIKEENETSPSKAKDFPTQNKPAEAEPASEPAKPMDKPPLKKIFIKSPNNKDYQIVKIISAISDESKKPISNSQASQPSNSQQSENVVDSSSKLESNKSPNKATEATPTKETNEKEALVPKIIIKNLVKVQESKTQSPSKETSVKSSPRKDTPVKEHPNINVSPTKDTSNKFTPTEDKSSKDIPATESTNKDSFIKKYSPKVILSKEITAKPIQPKESENKSSTEASPDISIVNNEQTTETTDDGYSHTENSKTDSLDNKLDDALSKSNVCPMDIDKEASNDSRLETYSDSSEKEHNKSISRELRSLINSAKESKIISECTQLTSKTRKSRAPLDSANTSLNTSVDTEKIQGARRNSDNSQKSSCSEQSEKGLKRSKRYQNQDSVTKVKHFLNSVSSKNQQEGEESGDEEQETPKAKENETEAAPSVSKKKKTDDVLDKPKNISTDPYCWRCHWAVEPAAGEKGHPPAYCTVCPRSFHYKCLSVPERKISTEKSWVCPECWTILNAEGSETRSPPLKRISLGMLCDLLKHALERMMEINGVEPFIHPVDRKVFPRYDKYVVHPMDLTQMKYNIASGQYGSTEAFLADAQWILHNSIIFNTLQSKLTGGARALVRSCRAEMGEIEACPECYAAAHARRPTWFTDVCTTPHVLLWAKLKGFPYWPAKGMSVNSAGLVDVRFFGAHDRAWVPARDCFLYSEKDPNNFRTKRQDILESMQEAEHHIRNISRKYGKFVYPPFRTQFDPSKLEEQLKMMIPSFEGEIKTPAKDKSNFSPSLGKDKSKSKNTKTASVDDETSENEEAPARRSRKMADGKEIAGEEDYAVEKEKEMEVDSSQNKDTDAATPRKRRRSALEEAVITIIESSSSTAKKKRAVSAEITSETKVSELVTTSSTSKSIDVKKEGDKPKTDEKNISEAQKVQDNEPSSSTSHSDKKRTPSRLISIAKVLKTSKVNLPVTEKTPTQKTENKTEKPEKTPQKLKPKTRKSDSTEKMNTSDDKSKDQTRRNSRNKSANNSNTQKVDKKSDKVSEVSENKEIITRNKDANKSIAEKPSDKSLTSSPRTKDRLQFDDDISLAAIARESKTPVTSNVTVLPCISSVRSLATTAQNTATTTATTTATPKTVEGTVQAASNSSIFTPTSTDNVKTMKDAVNKLQKLRNEDPPPVGRVGVRAFARMTSPSKETPKDVEVEIKTEPIDLDDSDRQVEKMDLMNAFQLRPVVRPTQTTNLREVRINKVVAAPPTTANAPAAITAAKNINNNSKARAKKTFPLPNKDDGRSELNSKNSMVYIPIQPPMSQAPTRIQQTMSQATRLARPLAPATLRAPAPNIVTTATASKVVSTVTSLVPVCMSTHTKPTVSAASTSQAPSILPVQTVPTIGQVPTTVHTVPLITSVNGQWTFSLQPVMSVGGIDGAPSPPMMNGLPERKSLLPLQAPPAPPLVSTSASAPTLVPAAPVPTVLVPTSVSQATSKSDSNPPREPPRLQQRPPLVNPLDANAPLGSVPPPSTAGALTAKLNQNSVKMTDFFRTLLEDCIEKLDDPLAQATALKLQLEQVQWKHQQLVEEIKHNHELTLSEMRSSFEKERQRVVNETRRAAQVELEAAVKLAKSKQWCANCSQEAQFYCCWNTSYCDYPCQRAHWTQHYAVCTQSRQDGSSNDSGNPPEDRLQPAPENIPKTTAAPSLTVGGKLAPSRVYTQDNSPKTSIIMSMVEDPSGNQTLKCVGTYKSPTSNAQIAPLIINKQIMSSEESKKVVTSGGYLIVGAGSGAPPTPSLVNARRTHTIQYFT